MAKIKLHIPDDLAEEYRKAASENAELMKDFAHADMEGWWNDKEFIKELDRRYEALESGEDRGVTIEQLKKNIFARTKK